MTSWNLQWVGFKEVQGVQIYRLRIQDPIQTLSDQEDNQDGEAGILPCLVLHPLVNHHIARTVRHQCSLSLPTRPPRCRYPAIWIKRVEREKV